MTLMRMAGGLLLATMMSACGEAPDETVGTKESALFAFQGVDIATQVASYSVPLNVPFLGWTTVTYKVYAEFEFQDRGSDNAEAIFHGVSVAPATSFSDVHMTFDSLGAGQHIYVHKNGNGYYSKSQDSAIYAYGSGFPNGSPTLIRIDQFNVMPASSGLPRGYVSMAFRTLQTYSTFGYSPNEVYAAWARTDAKPVGGGGGGCQGGPC